MSDEKKDNKVVFEYDDNNKEKPRNYNYGISSGLVFTASLFIGMGIGMAFKNTSSGTLLGLGVGFLLMAIIRMNEGKIGVPNHIRGNGNHGNYVIAIIGVLFILQAIGQIINFSIFSYKYFGSIFFIVLGVAFLAASGIFGNNK